MDPFHEILDECLVVGDFGSSGEDAELGDILVGGSFSLSEGSELRSGFSLQVAGGEGVSKILEEYGEFPKLGWAVREGVG